MALQAGVLGKIRWLGSQSSRLHVEIYALFWGGGI